jgi:hypothetical protein
VDLPSVFSAGDVVRVRVFSVDEASRRLELSMLAYKPNERDSQVRHWLYGIFVRYAVVPLVLHAPPVLRAGAFSACRCPHRSFGIMVLTLI